MLTFRTKIQIFSFILLNLNFLLTAHTFANHFNKQGGIPAHLAADYIHGVIEAGRNTYSKLIVDRLQNNKQIVASENWQKDNSLLLPAQFLRKSSEISNNRGIGMRYRLMSLWPINENNRAISENEKRGLEIVAENPQEPFTWITQTEGLWYFQAIYPDIAVTESCIACHNSHPKSPKTDFKLGDVMGGIVIDFPLGRRYQKKDHSKITIPPEVVADYVHSILESDRTVYSKYIVDRFKKEAMLQAREHWKKDNSLMLPAQFLMTTSEFIRNKKLGLDFQLISLWPINSRNGPANEFERTGLETISFHSVRPFIGKIRVGRNQFFQAVYPDLAVTDSCVSCHNSHPNSPKKNYKLFDVMGGIVVTLPMN